MKDTLQVLMIIGTRPEIIKMAPVYHACKKAGFRTAILHSGQHTGLASPFYKIFKITPEYSLKLSRKSKISDGQHLANRFSQLVSKISDVLSNLKPSVVLVHGDTLTAHAAALAAFYHKIPIGHVEAGLRSHIIEDPFPEEMNRSMIARIAKWHFCPTEQAQKNLLREGVEEKNTLVTGNTVIDAVLEIVANPQLKKFLNEKLIHFLKQHKRYILVTLHRRENIPKNIKPLFHNLQSLIAKHPDIGVIWPMHMNPDAKNTLTDLKKTLTAVEAKRLMICSPLDYMKLVYVLNNIWLVITDSGGIQEESSALNKPIIVARKTTERPEIISSGKGVLIPPTDSRIGEMVQELMQNTERYKKMQASKNPFGDGKASERIVKSLQKYLAKGQ
jgi:UDP-N-acetylglucosamine 2-epimerase